MTGELVLIVDDEANIVHLARLYLEREGFRVEAATDGQAALSAIESLKPSLVVLDLMLPKMDGLEVCRRLRAENNPVDILMLTAKDDEIDKIVGLELGADDYLTKPFNPRELVARVKALMRRGERLVQATIAPLRAGNLVVDPARREVQVGSKSVPMRGQEFELLEVLLRHKGLVLTREQLLQMAWGFDFAGQTRTVDVHISSLRKKLARASVSIETVTGIGYKLVAD